MEAASTPAPKPRGCLGSAIHLDGRDVILDLVADELAIGHAAASAVLLIHPEGHADGAARLKTELLHQRQRLQARDDRRAIVLRALSDVPRIDVAAHHHDLFGMLAAGNLADHVAAIGIGQHAARAISRWTLTGTPSSTEARHHHGVLGRDGGGGNLGLPLVVISFRRCAGSAWRAGWRSAPARRRRRIQRRATAPVER